MRVHFVILNRIWVGLKKSCQKPSKILKWPQMGKVLESSCWKVTGLLSPSHLLPLSSLGPDQNTDISKLGISQEMDRAPNVTTD